MQVQMKTEWMVCSPSGRAVQTFDDPVRCAQWLKARQGNGVSYQLKQVCTDVHHVHLEHGWIEATLGEAVMPPPKVVPLPRRA